MGWLVEEAEIVEPNRGMEGLVSRETSTVISIRYRRSGSMNRGSCVGRRNIHDFEVLVEWRK